MKVVGMVTWAVTAVAAILVGLKPLGYNMYEMQMFVAHPGLSDAVHYVIGIFGVISLLMLLSCSFGKDGCCCHSNKM